jgi:eukaryotic-like serine/threonine-protein kinase
MDADLASSVPGFTLIGELGRGAGTVVYRVTRDGADWAMKVRLASGGATELDLAAFRREAALLALANHPSLPHVHTVGLTQGRPYLVMDLIQGRPLAQVLSSGQLDESAIRALAVDVAEALAAAHLVGLIHRDVKPHNIMVQPDGRARLIDFGLATMTITTTHATDTVVGTLAYSAPEQSGTLNRVVDARSDLYSLGVVLFECATGAPPFASPDVGDLLRMHATVQAPDVSTLRAELTPGLTAVIATLLAKDPDDRYQSGSALVGDLNLLNLLTADTTTSLTVHRSLPMRAPHRVALTGRDAELTELVAHWHGAMGGQGAVVIVRGDQGAGKSRLLDELARYVENGRFPVLFAPADDSAPLAPLRRAIEEYLGHIERFEPTSRHRALGRLIGAAATAPTHVARLSPALAALMLAEGVSGGQAPDGPPARAAADEFTLGLAAFVVELARRGGGLCLCIDDAEHLDGATRRVLAQVAREVETTPTPLLIAAGVGADANAADTAWRGWLPPEVVRRVVTLGPLDDGAVAELIKAFTCGLSFDEELVARLAIRGGCTPLEILEYLTAVIEAGLLSPAWGSWELDAPGLDSLHLPDSVFGLVTRRIDRMGGPTRALLDVGAVIGRSFTGELASRVAALPSEREAGELLAEAAQDGVLLQRSATFEFTHERTRDAILERMAPHRRQELHHRVACELEIAAPGQMYAIAQHYLRGTPPKDPQRALLAWTGAGEQALAEHAGEEAVELLERAVELTGPSSDVCVSDLTHRQVLLADAYAMTGRLADTLIVLAQALVVATDPVERAQILLRTARGHLAAWDMEDAVRSATEGLVELRSTRRMSRAHLVLDALTSTVAGTFVEVTRLGFGTAAAHQRLRFQTRTDLLQTGEEAAIRGGRPIPAVLMSLSAMYAATRLGPSTSYVHFRVGRGIFCTILRLPGGTRNFARADRAATALGTPEAHALVRFGREVGRLISGKGDEQGSLAMIAEVGNILPLSEYLNTLCAVCFTLMGRGRMMEARTWYERAAIRVGATDLPDHNLELIGLATAAGLGRVAEGDVRLRQIDANATRFAGRGMRANYLATTAITAVEHHELGERFGKMAAEIRMLHPNSLLGPPRILYATLAYGMLERCRTAAEGSLPAALDDAEHAVRSLRRIRDDAILATHALVCAADLQLLRGDPRQAITALASSEAFLLDHDVPLATFEAARVRARACTVLNREAEAAGHARFAISIAEQFGWPHRANWVRTEFTESASPTRQTSLGTPRNSGMLTETASSSTYQRRLAALEQLSLASSRIVDPIELTRVALDEIIKILAAERAFLFLAEANQPALVPHLGRDAAGNDLKVLTEYGSTLVERVRVDQQPLVVTGTDEGAALGSRSAVMHGLRSILVAPLMLDGRLIGVVYLDSRIAKGMFTSADVGTLAAITTHVAAALETARAAELGSAVRAAEQQLQVAETMRDAMSELVSTLDPREVLTRLHSAMARALPADSSTLRLLDDDSPDRLPEPVDASDASEANLSPAAEGLLTRLLNADVPQVGSGSAASSLAGSEPASTGSWLAVPLRTREHVVGVLIFATARPDAYGAAEVELAAALAGQGIVAYDNALLFAEVRHLAATDGLTGVFNRRHFFTLAETLLEESNQNGIERTAVMLDIDFFKRVNDVYGHPVGDQVIQAVASRVNAITRDGDLLARYGGEEFALILSHPPQVATGIAERIRRVIAETPIETDAGPIPITVSVGIAHLSGDDIDPGPLLGRADLALYQAKQTGRNRVIAYEQAS